MIKCVLPLGYFVRNVLTLGCISYWMNPIGTSTIGQQANVHLPNVGRIPQFSKDYKSTRRMREKLSDACRNSRRILHVLNQTLKITSNTECINLALH